MARLAFWKLGRGRSSPHDIITGYAGYNEVCEANGIRRAGCWAHARRKFKDALDAGAKDAAWPLLLIGRLFALERAVARRAERRGLTLNERVELRGAVRARRSRALVERIHAAGWDLFELRSTLPKSKLGKAVKYLANQRASLDVFLDEPRIPIHNNDSERDMRHVVIGRKNWLVFASPKGGEVACRLYSLMLSCRQNGVDPEAYLADALMAVASTKASEIASLTPWAWGAARKAGASA